VRRAAALVALVLVSGCALGEILADYGDPVDLTAPALVGTWWGGTTRLIVFRADGTMAANDLPVPVLEDALPAGFDSAAHGADALGSWEVARPGTVDLSVEVLAGSPVPMSGPSFSALRDDDGVVGLWLFYSGDGGNSWTVYRKV